ncbi:MAG: hypothetical protein IJ530_00980 [Treponema sp.]|uniref:hypothetical protein n=1 Tax=Treponema sp. TaxID=166 RepID=UPI0025E1B011|nr:hypothetical protein [Treponema sp.]MBQ8678318.1 hypothetical protein [Treponema sp.]
MTKEISIKDENYIQISGWMLNELDLKGNELLIYALIHGFSQDGRSDYHGGLGYIAAWTNSTKQGVIKALKSLLEKRLIVKTPVRLPDGTQGARYWTAKSRRGKTQNPIPLNNSGKQSLMPDRSTEFTTIQTESGKQSLMPDRSTEFTTIQTESGKQSLTDKLSSPPNSTEFNGGGQLSLPNKNLEILNSNPTASEIPQKKQAEAETGTNEIISGELKALFGGHLVFDTEFVPEIARLANQFELNESDIPGYLRFAFGRTSEKKPKSVTNLFYRLAKSAAVMQDFVLEKKKSEAESKKDSVTCPVCGNENARRFQPCPVCHFDMSKSTDEGEIRLSRQIFRLPENEKQRFLAEYNDEIKRQLSVGFLEKMRNPQIQEDFRKRIAEIYRKYGITA